jgi:hypothetical protein
MPLHMLSSSTLRPPTHPSGSPLASCTSPAALFWPCTPTSPPMHPPPTLVADRRKRFPQQSYSDVHNEPRSHSQIVPTSTLHNSSNSRYAWSDADGAPRRRRPMQQPRHLPRPHAAASDAGPHFMQPTATSHSRRHKVAVSSSSSTPSSISLSLVQHSPISRQATCPSSIAATEPAHVAWLWNEVMSYASDTASSRSRRTARTASSLLASAALVDTIYIRSRYTGKEDGGQG